jgi:hypothetical protein
VLVSGGTGESPVEETPTRTAVAVPPLPPPRRPRDLVLRQAWGAYYAIWSVAVFLLLGIGLVASLSPPTFSLSVGTLLAYLFVATVAGMVTLRHFRAVWQETHFPLWKVGRGFLGSFLLFAVGLTVAGLWPTTIGYLTLGVVLVLVAAVLAYQLKWSLGNVPGEGWIAVGALLVSSLGSISAILLTHRLPLYGAFWLITVVVWGACAASAFLRTEHVPPVLAPRRSP